MTIQYLRLIADWLEASETVAESEKQVDTIDVATERTIIQNNLLKLRVKVRF